MLKNHLLKKQSPRTGRVQEFNLPQIASNWSLFYRTCGAPSKSAPLIYLPQLRRSFTPQPTTATSIAIAIAIVPLRHSPAAYYTTYPHCQLLQTYTQRSVAIERYCYKKVSLRLHKSAAILVLCVCFACQCKLVCDVQRLQIMRSSAELSGLLCSALLWAKVSCKLSELPS